MNSLKNNMIKVCKYLLFAGLWPLFADAQPTIQVEGLFKGGAILRIDGRQQLLKVGQKSVEGVAIIEADTQHVTIDINGERQRLGMNREITGGYAKVQAPTVTISRDSNNQYLSYAMINGKRTTVLLDTGATIVAFSSRDAKALGISYKQGGRSMVSTASGLASAYSIVLRSVAVGAITVSGVEAVVIEGAYPTHVLLGMSYLSQVEMSETKGIMTLRRKY